MTTYLLGISFLVYANIKTFMISAKGFINYFYEYNKKNRQAIA